MSISNIEIFKKALAIFTTATILTGCGGSKENQNLIGVARINETKYYRVTIDEEEYFIPITALLDAIPEKGTTCYVTIGINGKGNVVVNAADSEAELKNKQTLACRKEVNDETGEPYFYFTDDTDVEVVKGCNVVATDGSTYDISKVQYVEALEKAGNPRFHFEYRQGGEVNVGSGISTYLEPNPDGGEDTFIAGPEADKAIEAKEDSFWEDFMSYWRHLTASDGIGTKGERKYVR